MILASKHVGAILNVLT